MDDPMQEGAKLRWSIALKSSIFCMGPGLLKGPKPLISKGVVNPCGCRLGDISGVVFWKRFCVKPDLFLSKSSFIFPEPPAFKDLCWSNF
jgi:hypothetical protein